MDTLTFIGTICSIVGVPIALWQSYKAGSQAKAAKKAVEGILEKKQLTIYNEILERGHAVEKELNRQRGKKDPRYGNKITVATNAIDDFISTVNEKKHDLPIQRKQKIETSLKSINENRKLFNDENPTLSQSIEFILQHTQNIISEVSEEKQSKEYK